MLSDRHADLYHEVRRKPPVIWVWLVGMRLIRVAVAQRVGLIVVGVL
jgi:hypothetical protein